jgi:PAS domain S-box-containing protein
MSRAPEKSVYVSRISMPHTILPGERAGPYVPDYRTLFTHSPDAFIVSDTGTRIRAANAAAELLFSSPGTALLHKPLTSFVRRGERTSFRQRLKRLMNYQAIEDWEVTFSSPGQRPFTAAMTVKVLPGGKPSRILWSIRNITERKMTEIRMNDQNGNFRRIHESLPDIVYTTDRYDRITFITGAVGRLLGIPAEEFMGKNILCLIGILNNSPRIRAIESCCARGGDTVEHTVQMEIDGRLGMFELKETIRTDTAGSFSGVTGVLRDCTRRMVQADYRAMVEEAPLGMVIFQDMPVRIVFASSVFAAMTGYTPEELYSLSSEEIASVIHPDDRDLILKRYHDRMLGETRSFNYEIRIRHRNGSWRWLVMVPGSIGYYGNPAVLATFVDITDRKTVDLQELALEEISRSVLDDIPVGVFRTTPGPVNRFVFVNRPMARLLGYTASEELLKRSVYDVYANAKERDRILTLLQEQGTVRIEGVVMQRKDGSSFKAVISARAIRGTDNGIIWIQGILERMGDSPQDVSHSVQQESRASCW